MQLDRDLYDDVVVTAERNISMVSRCLYSEHYLFIAQSRSAVAKAASNASDALHDISDRFCSQPFTNLSTTAGRRSNGLPAFPRVFVCACPGFLPFSVSSGMENPSAEDIWNGPIIQEIRRSILDGDFTYCTKQRCPAIVNGQLPKRTEIRNGMLRDIIENRRVVINERPRSINLGHDPSCNLACPSCRKDVFTIKNNQRDLLQTFNHDILLPLMEHAEVTLVLSGDGDPFASKHYREILRNLDPVKHAKVRIMLSTNALLLTQKQWDELAPIHSLIEVIGISIDAARAETYEDIRRPGKWNILMENLNFLSGLRKQGAGPPLSLRFVVQKKNYREMPAFVRMGKELGVDTIRFQRLYNPGSYTAAEMRENNVCDPTHPECQELIEVFRDPVMKSQEVDLNTTIRPIFEAAQRRFQLAGCPQKPRLGAAERVDDRFCRDQAS